MNTKNNILSLVDLAGKIEGRTKFQKMVYILKCKGVAFQEKFKYHYYGPFSFDLQLEIDELVFDGFLYEKTDSEQANTAYSYSVNESAGCKNELLQYTDLIKLLNGASIKVLELTSTIFFLKNQEKITDHEVIVEKLKFLKPHLACYIDKAFDLEKKINSL